MRCTMHLLATLFFAAGAAAAAAEPVADQQSRETPASRIYRMRRSAVVSLRSTTMGAVPARLEVNEHGHSKQNLGTGLLIDPRGYVVTCHHVIKDMARHEAIDADGNKYRVRIVNYDAHQDLALLKLELPAGANKRFDHVPLWSNKAIVGENAYSIGNPYGLGDSLTVGYVGAVGRRMRMHHQESFDDLVQIDSGINPGNSGGPVFDVRGQLLGITVAIRREAQSLAFAIPTHLVAAAVSELMGGSSLTAARLGLEVKDDVHGEVPLLKVASVVQNGAAARQGLLEGDTLQSADGETLTSAFDLQRCFWERGPDSALKLKVGRPGKDSRELTLKPAALTANQDRVWQHFGLWVSSVNAERVEWIDPAITGGVLVTAVAPGGWGDQRGLQVGDIVYGMLPVGTPGYNMKSCDDICWVMRHDQFAEGSEVACRYIRDGALMRDVAGPLPKLRPGQ